MDREEKLRAAKERLKQFQKKRQKDGSTIDDSLSEPRMSPYTTMGQVDQLRTSKTPDMFNPNQPKTADLPVFTMWGNDKAQQPASAFDQVTNSTSSSMSNINFSPIHQPLSAHYTTSADQFTSAALYANNSLASGSTSAYFSSADVHDNASGQLSDSLPASLAFNSPNNSANLDLLSSFNPSANCPFPEEAGGSLSSNAATAALFQPTQSYDNDDSQSSLTKSSTFSISNHSESVQSNPSFDGNYALNESGVDLIPNFTSPQLNSVAETDSTNPSFHPVYSSQNNVEHQVFKAQEHFQAGPDLVNFSGDLSSGYDHVAALPAVPDPEISGLKKELEELRRSKEDLEKQLLVQASSIKQYDVYCQSLASELTSSQATLEKERRDFKAQLETETGSLRSQLQSHADSIKILVGEKAEFEAILRKQNTDLANKNAELSKLQDSSKNDTERKQREDDALAQLRSSMEDKMLQVKQELVESKQVIEDLNQEVSELRSKISSRDSTNEKLAAELKLKSSKLEMAELNLSQLRSVQDSDENRRDDQNRLVEKEAELRRLTVENEEHVKRVEELTAYIQQASMDREQIIHQYTSYSQQLTTQIESLSQQLDDRANETHILATREKDLVLHVQQLEDQLQKLIQSESLSKPKVDVAELGHLRQQVLQLDAKLLEIQQERDKLQETAQEQNVKLSELNQALSEKSDSLTEIQTQMEMFRSQSTADVSQTDLMAACQSDKVAASRAMVQNIQLKEQLEELQQAIVQVTNSKAEVMHELDQLRSTRTRQEKEENSLRMEMSGLHAGIAERDRTISHMRDQIKYYIAFAENSISGNLDSGPRDPSGEKDQVKKLIGELQAAKEEIRSLNSHNSELRGQLEVLSSRTRDSSGTPDLRDDSIETPAPSASMSSSPRPPPSPSPSGTSSMSSNTSSSITPNSMMPSDVIHENEPNRDVTKENGQVSSGQKATPLHRQFDLIPPLSSEVALLKLEREFKQAMSRIAELSADKEHLEHVIVQLQEETDTVGEYITIYQYQRQQQRKRLEENERQLQLVSRDREDLKSKLSQLQGLVTSFVKDDGPKKNPPLVNGNNYNGQIDLAEDALKTLSPSDVSPPKTKSKVATIDFIEPLAPVIVEADSTQSTPIHKPSSPSKADKILALISEIGANQMLNNMEDFHPWFWEHSPGKLINI